MANMFYEKILVNKLGSDEIIFDVLRNADSPKQERYIVYLDGSSVIFCTVNGKDIAPGYMAHLPYVERKYIVDPNNMTSVEGTWRGYDEGFYSDHEKIQNGVVFKGVELYSKYGAIQSTNIYIGITDRKIEGYPMETYSIDSLAEGKYIFMIRSKDEINFDDFAIFGF